MKMGMGDATVQATVLTPSQVEANTLVSACPQIKTFQDGLKDGIANMTSPIGIAMSVVSVPGLLTSMSADTSLLHLANGTHCPYGDTYAYHLGLAVPGLAIAGAALYFLFGRGR